MQRVSGLPDVLLILYIDMNFRKCFEVPKSRICFVATTAVEAKSTLTQVIDELQTTQKKLEQTETALQHMVPPQTSEATLKSEV